MSDCKHPKAFEVTDKNLNIHITVCPDCKLLRHVCFDPLTDDSEKALEQVKVWAQHYAKAAPRVSDGALIAQKSQKVIDELNRAMLHARIQKNDVLETVAQLLEERNQKEAAQIVRNLKLEVAVTI